MATWGPLWNNENDKFKKFLHFVPELRALSKVKFLVCDGNHRCHAWLNHIEQLHKYEAS